MPYDNGLAERIREYISRRDDIIEKKMFGGIAHLLNGNICCGIVGDHLVVRVGPDNYQDALAEDLVSAFDITGRAMRGWVMVAPEGIGDDDDLKGWIERGVTFALSLPPK